MPSSSATFLQKLVECAICTSCSLHIAHSDSPHLPARPSMAFSCIKHKTGNMLQEDIPFPQNGCEWCSLHLCESTKAKPHDYPFRLCFMTIMTSNVQVRYCAGRILRAGCKFYIIAHIPVHAVVVSCVPHCGSCSTPAICKVVGQSSTPFSHACRVPLLVAFWLSSVGPDVLCVSSS